MFIDAVDKVGRRYMEVPVFREGSALRRASEDSEAERCIECGASVRHGVDAYYQRNDASDGIQGDGGAASCVRSRRS